MLYKNKKIRSNYSVMFIVFIVGAVLTGVALLAAIYGAITAAKNVKDVQHIDTVIKASGNHAGHAVYFDITEAPVFLSKDKKSYYYLLTDGNEYRVADLDDEEYEEIKSAVEETGAYHIQGLTYYIVGSDKRSRVASRAGKLIGQNVTEKNMDDILGDVCIDQMKISFWNMFKGGFGMVGIIVGLIGVFIFWGSFGELRTSRKVISLSNITARDIDEEACKADSVWLDSLKIYLTENMVLGIISDGKKHEGQVALKYGEIQRIYGHNSTKGTERSYIVETIAIDGNKYILADSKYGMYSDDMKSELKELYRWVKDKNPNALFEPGNI